MPPKSPTNAHTASFNISSEILHLENLIKPLLHNGRPILVPENIKDSLRQLITHFEGTTGSVALASATSENTATGLSARDPTPSVEPIGINTAPKTKTGVKLNRQTALDILYIYDNPQHIVEYPETSASDSVGHLFSMDLQDWSNPALNFVYSRGAPNGSTTLNSQRNPWTTSLLVSDIDGEKVPCRVSHSTCQGAKACPMVDMSMATQSHVKASREELSARLESLNSVQRRTSPSGDLFVKTLSYFASLHRLGCGAPIYEMTSFSEAEAISKAEETRLRDAERRGHPGKQTCEGRLLFDFSTNGRPFIRCEHYSRKNTDHFIDFTVGNGLLDAAYLEALFFRDEEAIAELEQDAALDGIGPLAPCMTINNFNTIKVSCAFEHRMPDNGGLVYPALVNLACDAKFRVFEPLEEYRKECPRALVVCSGAHTHPIPIPSKTPPSIRKKLFELLHCIEDDIPDLTPRRLMRHASVKMYLHQILPHIPNPMLLDLHPSLANRDHLRSYIDTVQKSIYPKGTGWEGLQHLKQIQDESDPSGANHYIRYIGEFPELGQTDEADNTTDEDKSIPFRIAICMSRQNSCRLQSSHYIQCDIGFKRAIGFKEFELGGLDEVSGLSITYCRIYLNRQTAAAHCLIFEKIDEIVKQDTGHHLRWRHIHSRGPTADDAVGIFHIAVDQHGGQAKGLGMYLHHLALKRPLQKDLHEPHRNLQDLDEYDHLRRVLRLCSNHFLRNIQSCGVSEAIRKKMRSLMCIEHPNWEVTLREIQNEGGKPAKDWVADKIRSRFAFPGICWERSYIPLEIWQVGDKTSNIIEELHQDVNREGLSCTLVGGVKKGLHFDTLKDKTIETLQHIGVRPSYKRGNISESISRSLHRKSNLHSKILRREDDTIRRRNKNLEKALNGQSEAAAAKALAASRDAIGTGSGKVLLLLPRQS